MVNVHYTAQCIYSQYVLCKQKKAANVELIEKLDTGRCVECGMCTYICPSKIEVTDMVAKAKRRMQLAQRKKNA